MSEDINAKLQRNRDAIDAIDRQVVQLLNERVLQEGGRSEQEVLEKIARMNPGPLSNETVQAIYRTLMLAGLAPGAVEMDPVKVDGLDQQVINLLSERVQHAGEIGKIKHANGADYYDPTREAQVMAKVAALNPGPIANGTLQSVYREVISGSIGLEKRLVIGFLGPEATYTHQAAVRNFGVSLDYRALSTIPDVFTAVESGSADYGVIPIENSTEGAVFHSMDMLVESDLHICSQVYLPIEHCLISRSPLSEIKEVHSKDQALGQCREWLHAHLHDAQLVNVVSTVEAVRTASERPEVAAVAGLLSAQRYGVPIQQRSIQDRDDNVTRFLVIGKTRAKPLGDGKDKTSLVISLKDEVGALERALRAFAARGINLSKIESRPSRKKAWDYLFFIDFIGHYEDASVQAALKDLEGHCSFVKWLGSYPNVSREG
ncbi:prephenate dehydratase [Coraliomargarita akajimensis]|uniref:Bifunctional chorismate mutase/prephenate dehydratase n=1 Tax=Coraliomargarita akajimensis (strain DSM 45221 / IAM 15411 / JCM 23193 / KCTC 12865 / 04OKA010-24) TaxID=583355 RepID=D5EMV7_CORAD|nr:prephenate dehydratase [Coraliomargarita akajimensis]ADE55347.1 prephenate dehydratase [Coraliomargarita akajimensis DSM 45221]